MKEQYFNLRHEHSLLKCKLEGRQSEFSHRMEKLKVQHRTEVCFYCLLQKNIMLNRDGIHHMVLSSSVKYVIKLCVLNTKYLVEENQLFKKFVTIING